jgi:hypothetical protein
MPAREHAVSSNAPAHVPCRHRRIQHIQQHACTSPHHMYGLRQPPRPLDGADSESDTEEEDPPMCPAGLFEHAEAFFTT